MSLCALFILALFTTASSDSTLKYVQILFRHGDRTPSHAYPNDPYQAESWPEGWKKLTPQGMRDAYLLGQAIRSRYVNTGFLPGNYTADDMYMLSSQEDRCTMSAYCMLAGLYPPSGHQIWNPAIPWQPVPVHTLPKGGDFLLRVPCPTYDVLYDKMMESEYVANLTQKYADLINVTGRYTGYEATFENMLKMVDPIYVETTHNMTLPDWLRANDTYKRYLAVKDLTSQLKFPTMEMARIRGGPILKYMIKNMEDMKDFNNITHKVDFYSGHSTTLNGFLSALKVYNKLHLMYAAAVFVELHHSRSDGWTVQIYYRNDTTVPPYLLTVPGCSSSCPLSELKRLTKDAVPDDVIEECLGPRPTPTGHTCSSAAPDTPTIAGPTAPSSGYVERSDLDCSAGQMHVHIPLSLLPIHTVTLRDPTCKVTSNGTHLVADVGLNECGTTVSFTNNSVIFTNDIVATVRLAAGVTTSNIIDYGLNKDNQRVAISCVFPRENRIDFGYVPLQRKAHFYEKQYGNLIFEINQYQDEQFTRMLPHTGLPIGVTLNTEIFIDIAVDHNSNKGVGITVESCIATPTQSPADPVWYPLIKNGCPVQSDIRTFSSPDENEFRFSFLAFKFTRSPLQKIDPSLPASPMVYLHCQVFACPRQNCTSSCQGHSRSRREAESENAHLISAGPFYLKSEEESQGYSGGIVAGTLSVACLTTLIALVAVVAWRRSVNKLSRYQNAQMTS